MQTERTNEVIERVSSDAPDFPQKLRAAQLECLADAKRIVDEGHAMSVFVVVVRDDNALAYRSAGNDADEVIASLAIRAEILRNGSPMAKILMVTEELEQIKSLEK